MSFNNIKVHFAGDHSNRINRMQAIYSAGVRRFLFSAYPYIKTTKSKDIKRIELDELRMPWKHIILDSGLFTLMFGAQKDIPKTESLIEEWMLRLCKFVSVNDFDNRCSIVEVDCQKVISPEFAWDVRKEMRKLLPGREIINVFHLEDGQDGFRKLCEFSDYIAISVPELRIAQPKSYKNTTCALARMARQIKPGIKIHLLGCTEEYLLRNNKFCTSADSSSWSSPIRFGYLGKNKISTIKPEAIESITGKIQEDTSKYGMTYTTETDTTRLNNVAVYLSALECLDNYSRWGGSQD